MRAMGSVKDLDDEIEADQAERFRGARCAANLLVSSVGVATGADDPDSEGYWGKPMSASEFIRFCEHAARLAPPPQCPTSPAHLPQRWSEQWDEVWSACDWRVPPEEDVVPSEELDKLLQPLCKLVRPRCQKSIRGQCASPVSLRPSFVSCRC